LRGKSKKKKKQGGRFRINYYLLITDVSKGNMGVVQGTDARGGGKDCLEHCQEMAKRCGPDLHASRWKGRGGSRSSKQSIVRGEGEEE